MSNGEDRAVACSPVEVASASEGGRVATKGPGAFPLRCGIALVAIVSNALALNLFVGPSAGAYPSYAGFAPALAAVVAYGVLLIVSRKRPAALGGPAAVGGAAGLFVVGALLVAGGYVTQSTPASLAGWLLATCGTAWVVVMVSLTLSKVEPKLGFTLVLSAFALVYVVAAVVVPALSVAPYGRLPLFGFYVFTFAVAFISAQKAGRAALASFSREDAALVDGSLRPRLPLVCAVLFALGAVCGYTAFVVFGTRESAGVSFWAVAAALLIVIVVSRFARSRTDAVFHFGLLLVLAGLLVVPFIAQTTSGERVALVYMSNTLLTAGSECFALLVWIVLAVRGARYPTYALVTAAGGRLALACGMLAGLVLGLVASSFAAVNPLVPDMVAVAVAFVLVAYALVGLRRFSFEESFANAAAPMGEARAHAHLARSARASETQQPVESPEVPSPQVSLATDTAASIECACEALAHTGGLTVRETEILKMLARGRSAPFIAQELVISQNTVKTHVKHIYAKLDAHSQQEIIDLVDAASC